MKRNQTSLVLSIVAVMTFIALMAVFVTHVKPYIPLWAHRSGHTLTQVELLPRSYWGYGTTRMTMTTATGAPIDGGSRTMVGCLVVYHYDLRVWQYDPKSGLICYTTD